MRGERLLFLSRPERDPVEQTRSSRAPWTIPPASTSTRSPSSCPTENRSCSLSLPAAAARTISETFSWILFQHHFPKPDSARGPGPSQGERERARTRRPPYSSPASMLSRSLFSVALLALSHANRGRRWVSCATTRSSAPSPPAARSAGGWRARSSPWAR